MSLNVVKNGAGCICCQKMSLNRKWIVSVLCVPCCLGRVTGGWLSGSIMPFKMKPHADTLCELSELFLLAGKLKVNDLQIVI